jgi:WD40 repeat protein/DNA-binding SARP family transcriptional activator
MGVAVLGPLEVDGQPNDLSPRDRVVLSALVVGAGEAVATETLADALWAEELPRSWPKVLQGCVVRLRKRLGRAAIESVGTGYRLALADDELDHRAFERLLRRARDALAGGDPARAGYLAQEALDLWRGSALPDLDDWLPGRVEAARLEGMRMEAEELLVEAQIDAGRGRHVVDRARALTDKAPYRERSWALLARALHQSGREPEALGAIRESRGILVEEFGLDPSSHLVELERQLLRQDPALVPSSSPVASATCPYRGLLPYDAADADAYFGRNDDITACLRRLRDNRVLTVVGPSGVGKSSLVRAGLVAWLARSGIPVSVTVPGAHPLESLVDLKPRGRQTLVVDQAEEVVTLCADPVERARYFEALSAHAGAGGALVLALRADHLGDFAAYPQIARVVEEGLYLLGSLGEVDLRAVIERPAHRAGLHFEPGLVDLLIRDVEGEPAALPLLSHALRETWLRREGPTLTVEGYRATGGIRQAVAQSAESLYDSLDEARRGQLRRLLLRLVVPGEGGEPVRTRLSHDKVAADVARSGLVEQLVAARLVTVDGDTLQIAHEALVRVWPRLRGWLDEDVEGQRAFQHLASSADAWEAMGRPDSELYRGARLGRIEEWRERETPDLTDAEAAFLAASAAAAESETRAAAARIAQERRVNRRLRGALGVVASLLVLSVVAGAVTLRSLDRATEARALADTRRAAVEAPLQEDLTTGLLLAVAAVQQDGTSQAWDSLAATLTRAGAQIGQRDVGAALGRAGSSLRDIAVAGDGSVVATSTTREGVPLFDATTLEPAGFAGRGPASDVVITPDGRTLIWAVNQWTGTDTPRIDERPLRVSELPGGEAADEQLGGIPSNTFVDYTLTLSADGRRAAAILIPGPSKYGGYGHYLVWELADRDAPILHLFLREPAGIALNRDGSLLYAARGGALQVVDVATGAVTSRGAVDRANRLDAPAADNVVYPIPAADAIDASPDGGQVAVGAGDIVQRYDAVTLRPLGRPLTGHRGPIHQVRYSHDGRLLASVAGDRAVNVWDAETGARLHTFVGGPGGWGTVEFAPDDTSLYTSGDDGVIRTWRVAGSARVLTLGESSDVTGATADLVAAAPDGHTVASVAGGVLWFVDTATGVRTRAGSLDPTGLTMLWSPDASWLLTNGHDRWLRLWDVATGSLSARSEGVDFEGRMAFTPDGDRVVVAEPSRLGLLDRATLRWLQSTDVGPVVRGLAVDPADGTAIVMRGNGSLVRVRPETHEILQQGPPGMLTSEDQQGVVSPDGHRMLTVNRADHVQLLDLDTLTYLGDDTGNRYPTGLAYSPDGSQVASVHAESIRLWDGRTGRYLASLPLPSASSDYSLAYLPDSSGLLLAGTDGRTWTADTRTRGWVDKACAIVGRNLTAAEWQRFFPTRDYEVTCPAWPAGA